MDAGQDFTSYAQIRQDLLDRYGEVAEAFNDVSEALSKNLPLETLVQSVRRARTGLERCHQAHVRAFLWLESCIDQAETFTARRTLAFLDAYAEELNGRDSELLGLESRYLRGPLECGRQTSLLTAP